MLVSGIPLGYTFGRLGNFINGELYGRITHAPWGMVFPGAESFPASQPWVKDFASSVGLPIPSATALVNLPRHPSQLYEGFFEGLVLWLILWFIVRRRRPYKGFSIACYMLGYGVIRFFIEYVRQPDKGIGMGGYGYPIVLVKLENFYSQFTLFNFTTGQILNVLLIAAAVVVMLLLSARSRRTVPQQEAPHPTGRKLRKKLK
jgi:phosphatidylglycerol:prolipoprotein diacylglycerol transferase